MELKIFDIVAQRSMEGVQGTPLGAPLPAHTRVRIVVGNDDWYDERVPDDKVWDIVASLWIKERSV